MEAVAQAAAQAAGRRLAGRMKPKPSEAVVNGPGF